MRFAFNQSNRMLSYCILVGIETLDFPSQAIVDADPFFFQANQIIDVIRQRDVNGIALGGRKPVLSITDNIIRKRDAYWIGIFSSNSIKRSEDFL